MATRTKLQTTEKAHASTRQTASAHQLLRVRLIEAALADLRTMLMDAVEENPLLEIEEGSVLLSGGEQAAGLVEGLGPISAETDRGTDNALQRRAHSSLDAMRDYAAIQSDNTDYRVELRLLSQQTLASKAERTIAEEIIDMIDEEGYFVGNLSAIAAKCGCSVDDAQSVLEQLQASFENGIGASNPVEATCLQIGDASDRALAYAMLSNNLEDIKAGRYSKIAKEHGVSKKRIVELIEAIRQLDLTPTNWEEGNEATYVYPDIIARTIDGQLKVRVTGSGVPLVRISSYAKLVDDHTLTREERAFISERARDASNFISALEARNELLGNFANLLVEREYGFLTTADAPPVPLNMRDVAEALGVSTSTISRLCKNKYILTDRGIFPLGHFFMKSFVAIKTSAGQQMMQSNDVENMVVSMIEAEDPSTPLSDQQIADSISEQLGIALARRTVAKYRSHANIPNSSVRRQQH